MYAIVGFYGSKELSHQIEEYINAYDPEDQLEWSLVLTEAKSFVEVSEN